jgi:hypothetical protein
MNSKLSDAIARVRELPEERQAAAAEMLLFFLDNENTEVHLTPEQWAEVEAAMRDDEPYASSQEVEAFFAKFKA